MKLKKYLKSHKILLLNVVLSIYVATNLIGGERGLVSYFKKNEIMEELKIEEKKINREINELNKKNKLLSKNLDLDYLDILYREKFKFGKKNEIIIKLK
tara:strand:- start:138 stop:434 length:297 start_codon:yes stop_codon:yes gene_type:complete